MMSKDFFAYMDFVRIYEGKLPEDDHLLSKNFLNYFKNILNLKALAVLEMGERTLKWIT